MTKFSTLIGIVFLFISTISFGQTDHLPGEIIVQFTVNTSPDKIALKYAEIHGAPTGIESIKLISKPMNMYKITLNTETSDEVSFLRKLKADREVRIAQFNHYVYPRSTVPNDPSFSTQWHHINDGSNGLEDADIDSDLAWDITTGGLTALGDTIVVCVIEGGNLMHNDLVDNTWYNHNEIPGNGIDDDNNGYIDDYKGWNVQSESDGGVYIGGHGTNVMGMIGAKGNNELGGAGINWDVKIMSVAGEDLSNEASIVAAYTYPLVQRMLYNETQGENGAFVVVTNASWGIDGGDPEDYPIWSAIYDTLGVHGILNCGATSNNNVNVDVVGDVPTAVPSDYMISVTATNSYDQRTFSGYGVKTIDLGAPGQDVSTSSGSNGMTTTSGTSFASPLTAGVIALLYSVPCIDFAEMARDNPRLGADYIRHVLLTGVDPVESLELETVTGGRLNAYNSLSLILDDCAGEFCLPPFSFNYEVTNDSILSFSWNLPDDQNATLRYRLLDTEDWTYVEDLDSTYFQIDSLPFCTNYEFQIANNCSGITGDLNFASSLIVKSAGCCEAPLEYAAGYTTETEIGLLWAPGFNIAGYEIYYRVQESDDWIYSGQTSVSDFVVSDLDTCTTYEILIKPDCVAGFDVGAHMTIRTKGCGACLDIDYCSSFGQESYSEFINSVAIGDYTNQSGNNGGYAIFENTGVELQQSGEYSITLTPGYGFFAYYENFRLWIDLNQDGEFSDNEILFQTNTSATNAVTGVITIPEIAELGPTRMRVSMKYDGGSNSKPTACGQFDYGETEDYCVEIVLSTGIEQAVNQEVFELYPNPSSGAFTLNFQSEFNKNTKGMRVNITDLAGKSVYQGDVKTGLNTLNSALSDGVYMVQVATAEGEILKTEKLVIAQ